MMKMQMRLQKTQVNLPLVMELTANLGSFDRSLYSEAGYTDYEAIVIGGSGGKSGDAFGNAAQDVAMYSSGGGGGGSIRLKGKLADLQVKSVLVIGAAGANGADATNKGKAGNGGDGGPSSFNGHSAQGGTGAIGGNWGVNTTTGAIYPQEVGRGGNGGGNGANLGGGGVGGKDTYAQGFNGTNGGDDNSGTDATAGTYVVSSPQPDIIGGGHGGGGGTGAVTFGTATRGPVRDGAAGNSTGATAPGGAAGTLRGGAGGGANAGVVVGGNSYYGNGPAGTHFGGVIALKIS